MKRKKYVKALLIMMLSVLMFGLVGCKKEPTSNKKEEEVLVIEEREENESLKESIFTAEPSKNETSRAETLGTSKTLEVISSKEDTGKEDSDEPIKSEWIPGIW